MTCLKLLEQREVVGQFNFLSKFSLVSCDTSTASSQDRKERGQRDKFSVAFWTKDNRVRWLEAVRKRAKQKERKHL